MPVPRCQRPSLRLQARPLWLLVAAWVLLLKQDKAPCFATGRARVEALRRPGELPGRWAWPLQQHPVAPRVQLAATKEKQVSVTDFVLGAGIDSAEMEALAASVSKASSTTLWDMAEFEPAGIPSYSYSGPDDVIPELSKYERWMDQARFEKVARQLNSQSSDKTIEALFMVLARGNGGFITKPNVDIDLQAWAGSGSGFDAGQFQLSMFWARFTVAFAFWFLNVFAPFSTYFFFVRAPLLGFTGIDLLPGLPKWWERVG